VAGAGTSRKFIGLNHEKDLGPGGRRKKKYFFLSRKGCPQMGHYNMEMSPLPSNDSDNFSSEALLKSYC
jgi:hypothetical protein